MICEKLPFPMYKSKIVLHGIQDIFNSFRILCNQKMLQKIQQRSKQVTAQRWVS